jgi:hypothetical protein
MPIVDKLGHANMVHKIILKYLPTVSKNIPADCMYSCFFKTIMIQQLKQLT